MSAPEERTRVAVLGAGLIGIDLADKIRCSPGLDLRLIAGRSRSSVGLARAAAMGIATSAGGIDAVVASGPYDVVFDASNATAHAAHWQALEPTGTTLIDLTPSRLGTLVVPTINGGQAAGARHINLISCGGQAAIPILAAFARHCAPTCIEVVSTGASASAGRATRLNLDEYIATTQSAIRTFTGTEAVKVLVNLSPAQPPPPFRVVMTVLAPELPSPAANRAIRVAAAQVAAYAPGFTVTSVSADEGRVTVAVEVTARGGRMPAYAGNLDIINGTALLLAEQHAAAPARRRSPACR
ncbi:acetaldehyde dehydrogenase [Streptomyces aurantiacus]|uniref:acetylating acetaldehyde dehydrogenase n=1 Tax=Streptomyces aurantiacus TaxID=47760 RepID=UPI00278CB7A1|nr:acetaldehyde dehydrogenase (acetylating) [Streptomyces aurantiacus]MDQ0771585.1 acetaldehyde dehydrogenase [Streptomyces aurantiacus]